jgi:hypothetical protein
MTNVRRKKVKLIGVYYDGYIDGTRLLGCVMCYGRGKFYRCYNNRCLEGRIESKTEEAKRMGR